MESLWGRGRLAACALAAAAVIVAGCGSSGSSSSSASSAAAPSPAALPPLPRARPRARRRPAAAPARACRRPRPAASASAAGEKAAAKEGAAVKLPQETIGIVNVLQASEAAQRLQAGAEQAAKALGWKVSAVDAAGDPTKSESDIVAFVNEGVGAIVDLSNPTAAITQGLAQARAKNIPVINIGGLQDPSPNLAARVLRRSDRSDRGARQVHVRAAPGARADRRVRLADPARRAAGATLSS